MGADRRGDVSDELGSTRERASRYLLETAETDRDSELSELLKNTV